LGVPYEKENRKPHTLLLKLSESGESKESRKEIAKAPP
jgi:hypothetical protein